MARVLVADPAGAPELRTLLLVSAAVGEAGASALGRALLKRGAPLRGLDLSDNAACAWLGKAAVDSGAGALNGMDLDALRATAADPDRWDFAGRPIGVAGAGAVAAVLASGARPARVDLSQCGITGVNLDDPSGLKAVAEALDGAGPDGPQVEVVVSRAEVPLPVWLAHRRNFGPGDPGTRTLKLKAAERGGCSVA